MDPSATTAVPGYAFDPAQVFTFLFVMLGPIKLLGPFSQQTRSLTDAERNRLAIGSTVVSALAAMPDDTVWVSSFAWGLAHLDSAGGILGYALTGQSERFVSSLARDPSDNSVWAGLQYGGGVTRLKGGDVDRYGTALGEVGRQPVVDIQSDTNSPHRRMLVGFGATSEKAGVVGIYDGK